MSPNIILVRVLVALFVSCACSTVFSQDAETKWPDFISKLQPGPSNSSVAAQFPPDTVVDSAAAGVASDKAAWLGRWKGWADRNRADDIRLAIASVNTGGATIFYAAAGAKFSPYSAKVDAQFFGDELRATLDGGARIVFRMRKSGDLDFMWAYQESVVVGVLAKEQ